MTKSRRDGEVARSDVLVLFGVTGDLAGKMNFPALYALAKRGILRGILNVPVVGVAAPKWNLAQLRQPAMASITQAGKIEDRDALDHFLSLLQYVGGDYNNPETFTALKQRLGEARHPAHYFAIPPSLFTTVGHPRTRRRGLGRACARHSRKDFGRDLASGRVLNRVAQSVFPENSIFRIDHFLGKEPMAP